MGVNLIHIALVQSSTPQLPDADLSILPGFCASPAILRRQSRSESSLGHRPPPKPWREAAARLKPGRSCLLPLYEWAGSGVAFHTAALITAGSATVLYRQRHLRLAAGEFEILTMQPGDLGLPLAQIRDLGITWLLGSDAFCEEILKEAESLAPQALIWCHAAPHGRLAAIDEQAQRIARRLHAVVLVAGRPQDEDDPDGSGGSAAYSADGIRIAALGRDQATLDLQLGHDEEGCTCVQA